MNAAMPAREGGRRRAPPFDVVVAGGGMVGAAAALALAREGFAVAVVEARAPVPWQAQDEVDLRVVGLAPSSIRLLDALQVWSSLRAARVSMYRRMHVWDAASGAAIDFDAAAQGQSALGAIVENRLVQWLLWQALEHAGVQRLCPSTVTASRAEGDRIVMELDGAQSATLSARLLVAADGAGSPLRALAGIGIDERDYGQRAVVAHVRSERVHESTAWQRFLPGGPLALLPLADGRNSLVWSLPHDEAARVLALDDEAFLVELGVASDFRLGRMLATTRRAAFPLTLQLARRYDAERLVLLGDAAHRVHPLAGQGVNLGLRDVAELRDVLRAARTASRDLGAPSVLRRYARRRRSADTLDALGFDALARIYGWQAPPLVALRALGVRALDRLPAQKHRLVAHAAGE